MANTTFIFIYIEAISGVIATTSKPVTKAQYGGDWFSHTFATEQMIGSPIVTKAKMVVLEAFMVRRHVTKVKWQWSYGQAAIGQAAAATIGRV